MDKTTMRSMRYKNFKIALSGYKKQILINAVEQ